jgi:protein TonB
MLDAHRETDPATEIHQPSANDRFKQRSGRWFWSSLTAATLVHFGVFALMPGFSPTALGGDRPDATQILPPPDIDIPTPPAPIPQPALPMIGTGEVSPDITIGRTTFPDNSVQTLPPPPSTQGRDISQAPTVTPFTVRPRLENEAEVASALMRYYPPLLRDAGISGTVKVWFFIDDTGKVVRTQINVSSGYEAFDAAAVKVANLMKFSPAQNRDQKVAVWVSIPIVFQIQ